MTWRRGRREAGMTPYLLSALLHCGAVAIAVLAFRNAPAVALPPAYRVDLVAAPPGDRAIGEVQPAEAPPDVAKTVPPPEPMVKQMPSPTRAPEVQAARQATPVERAQPVLKKTAAPKAGGGPTGGKGSDVANVHSDGIEFPFPGYLNNIVRQIAVNFRPRESAARLKADVSFLIHRDGTVSAFRFIKRSGVYAFDLEAQGAVEAASAARAFGPLPAGFPDDVLPVVFSFDPEFLK